LKDFNAADAVASPLLQDDVRPSRNVKIHNISVGIATEPYLTQLPYSDDVAPGLDRSRTDNTTQSARYADFDEPRTPGNPFMISNINPSISQNLQLMNMIHRENAVSMQ